MDVKGMVEYKNGRIYKLVCNTTGLVYIGSTTRPLYKRKNSHLSHYNQWKKGNSTYITAFRIIENGDFDIVLIEQVECNTKEELHRAERRWIEQSDCVNKQVPTRDRKEYYYSHLPEQQTYRKQYYADHRDERSDYNRKYREDNKERLNMADREYYMNHRHIQLEKKRQPYSCDCGSTVTIHHRRRHERSLKHQQWLTNMNVKAGDEECQSI